MFKTFSLYCVFVVQMVEEDLRPVGISVCVCVVALHAENLNKNKKTYCCINRWCACFVV